MTTQPILLLASERSGTNLLRSMFDQHSQISGPSSPQMLKILWRYIECYGDLRVAENVEAVAGDAVALARSHVSPWPIQPEPGALVAAAPTQTLCGIVGQLYSEMAKFAGKTHWFCKENELWRFVYAMAQAFPGSRIVYLFRDGRDFALSIRKSVLDQKTWLDLARQWRDEQMACMKVCADLAADRPVATLSYEELIAHPEETLQLLCENIGVPFDPAMLKYHESHSAENESKRIQAWKNLSKPVLQNNSRKYETEAKPKDVDMFERVAGDVLAQLGYRLENGLRTGAGLTRRELFWNYWERRRLRRQKPPQDWRKERNVTLQQIEARANSRKTRSRRLTSRSSPEQSSYDHR